MPIYKPCFTLDLRLLMRILKIYRLLYVLTEMNCTLLNLPDFFHWIPISKCYCISSLPCLVWFLLLLLFFFLFLLIILLCVSGKILSCNFVLRIFKRTKINIHRLICTLALNIISLFPPNSLNLNDFSRYNSKSSSSCNTFFEHSF